MTTLNNIQQTVTFQMACDEARELSWKYLNTIHVIYRNNSLITSMSKEDGQVLCSFKLGNKI
jgi:hypothetical protein